jgi:peptidoglycan/LPS O-acetylase OafA/YrhL
MFLARTGLRDLSHAFESMREGSAVRLATDSPVIAMTTATISYFKTHRATQSIGPDPMTASFFAVTYACLALAFAAFAQRAMRSGTLLQELLSWRPLRRLGEVRYSVHLLHCFMMQIPVMVIGTPAPKFAVRALRCLLRALPIFGLCLVSSLPLYLFVERRFLARPVVSGRPNDES